MKTEVVTPEWSVNSSKAKLIEDTKGEVVHALSLRSVCSIQRKYKRKLSAEVTAVFGVFSCNTHMQKAPFCVCVHR